MHLFSRFFVFFVSLIIKRSVFKFIVIFQTSKNKYVLGDFYFISYKKIVWHTSAKKRLLKGKIVCLRTRQPEIPDHVDFHLIY